MEPQVIKKVSEVQPPLNTSKKPKKKRLSIEHIDSTKGKVRYSMKPKGTDDQGYRED